jgi:phosphate transport system substrate-binding protein
LIDAEVKAFEGIYTNASITPLYVSEAEAVKLLLDDSVRLAVLTRKLTQEEKDEIIKQRYTATESKVAKEGIALIVNRNNPDTLWDMTKVKKILSGENPKQKIVFDNANSGIVRYVLDSVLHTDKMPGNSYAAETNEGVVDYVTKEKDAIGLIGTSWISDSDDSVANRFLNSIRVVAIENKGDHYKPFQAYIAQNLYHLTREVYVTSREGRAGLGTGFAAFVAGDKGQRVILKAGMVPTTMPIRLVEIRREAL